jgi:phenylacetate-CoA ligase
MYGCTPPQVEALMDTFRRAAERMPAYATILREAGISPGDVKGMEDFGRLPVLDKYKIFQRFDMHDIHLDGELGPLSWVLTSSGASGLFSFGLYDPPGAEAYKRRLDEALDAVFQVCTRRTLLLNCLPMGVKLYSRFCTLGETSVRADMACGLMEKFGQYHKQVVFVGETAFIKHLLELGIERGIDWKKPLVHVVLGEELVAENARKYIEQILGTAPGDLDRGLIGASMGVAELGLNLFFEVPPIRPIILLRRAMHDDKALRELVLGPGFTTVPALFNYLPERIYVEFVDGKLVITTLDPTRPIPLVRYTPDDHAEPLNIPDAAREPLEAAGVDFDELRELPLIVVHGRGHFARAGEGKVYPEEVKEGIYHDPALARLTTANFRLASGDEKAKLRIQLSPGVEPGSAITAAFADNIARYATAPIDVTCEPYATFGSGMSVDYEVKYDYMGE